jgi:hypothetical protein
MAKYHDSTIDFPLLADIITMRKEFQESVEGAGAIANQSSYT